MALEMASLPSWSRLRQLLHLMIPELTVQIIFDEDIYVRASLIRLIHALASVAKTHQTLVRHRPCVYNMCVS